MQNEVIQYYKFFFYLRYKILEFLYLSFNNPAEQNSFLLYFSKQKTYKLA